MNLNRIRAIVAKEMQDLIKNSHILTMYPLPLIIAILYANFIPQMSKSFAAGFGIMFMVIMGGIYTPSMMIAEEKEKHTLEVLLLSPAKPLEIFIGKGFVTFVSILLTCIIILLATGAGFTGIDVVLAATLLGTLFTIFMGMTVGLYAPNQMATGAIGMPVYLILILVPLLGQTGNQVMEKIAHFIPSYYLMESLRLGMDQGKHIFGVYQELLILFAWAAGALLLLLQVYRMRKLEH